MKKTTPKKLSGFLIAFLAVAVLFLAVGLGTLGSFHSLGESYLLPVRQEGDQDAPGVVFHLENPKDEEGKTISLKVVEAYVNVAVIYSEPGVPARLTIAKDSSASGSFSTSVNATLENFYTPETGEDGKAVVTTGKDVSFRYVMPFLPTSSSSYVTSFGSGSSWYVSSYPYLRLSATSGVNVLINEIVFVGVRTSETVPSNDPEAFAEMERYVIPARVDTEHTIAVGGGEEAAELARALTDDAEVNYPEARFEEIEAWNRTHPNGAGEGETAPVLTAKRLSDLRGIFPVSRTSYSAFTKDEIAPLMTIAEMKQGATYYNNADGARGTYYADGVYGAFGIDFLALGTAMFGTSQFGLRFFPMLAVFGALVVLSRFAARLARSEKAGFVFSVLFALSSFAIGLGHTGTPFAVGLFFFACGLDLIHRFYANGMGRATVVGALPVFFGGLFLAAAICVQGAFLIPSIGVVALFVAGMVRVLKAKRYALAKLEAEPETPETLPEEGEEAPEPKAVRIQRTGAEYKFRLTASPVLFAAGLVVGAFLFALIGMVPAYYAYMKVYDPAADLANPTINVFTLAWQTFVNGFIGSNPVSTGGEWDFLRIVFTGKPLAGEYLPGGTNIASPELYGVTMYTVNWVAALAVLVGLAVAVWLVVRALLSKDGKAVRVSLRRLIVPLVPGVLAIVAAACSPVASGFLVLAWAMGFALAAPVFAKVHEGREKIAARAVEIVGLVLLLAVFGLLAVYTFSIPLASTLQAAVIG